MSLLHTSQRDNHDWWRCRHLPTLCPDGAFLCGTPNDLTNILIGPVRVRWPLFIVANMMGSRPGVLAIVLAGASTGGAGGLLPSGPMLLASAARLLVSAVVVAALWLRERRAA